MDSIHTETAEKIIEHIYEGNRWDIQAAPIEQKNIAAILEQQYGAVVEAVHWYLDEMMTTESSDIPDWTNIIELARRCNRWGGDPYGTGNITPRKSSDAK